MLEFGCAGGGLPIPILELRPCAEERLPFLEELLLRVSYMIKEVPEIAEMDLNPVKVLQPGQGCVVVDTRILLKRTA